MMTDYSLRVGIDISAHQVSATWGTMPDDEQPVVTVEQSTSGYRALIQQLRQTDSRATFDYTLAADQKPLAQSG
jgi:hypothetical protein